jgi:hypothetical protein
MYQPQIVIPSVTQSALFSKAPQERLMMILADWSHLPYELSHPGTGWTACLLQAQEASRALNMVRHYANCLEALVIDEDYFGSPEDTADACYQIRRMVPGIRIMAIATDMWEDGTRLQDIGASDDTLLSRCPMAILETLQADDDSSHH